MKMLTSIKSSLRLKVAIILLQLTIETDCWLFL